MNYLTTIKIPHGANHKDENLYYKLKSKLYVEINYDNISIGKITESSYDDSEISISYRCTKCNSFDNKGFEYIVSFGDKFNIFLNDKELYELSLLIIERIKEHKDKASEYLKNRHDEVVSKYITSVRNKIGL